MCPLVIADNGLYVSSVSLMFSCCTDSACPWKHWHRTLCVLTSDSVSSVSLTLSRRTDSTCPSTFWHGTLRVLRVAVIF